MERSIIIAGSGGQGILFLGRILVSAGMLEGRKVTWFPSYGAEIRGGTANCTVIISDEMIGSPVVMMSDILIAMNANSLERFLSRLRKKGTLFYDSSLITTKIPKRDFTVVPVPSTKIACEMGNPKSPNMVMLGAFIAKTQILRKDSLLSLLEASSDPHQSENFMGNKRLMQKGIEYIEDS